jgi:peroxiredoxin
MGSTIRNVITAITLFILAISGSGFKSLSTVSIVDFSLRNADGKMFSTTDNKEAKGYIIVFTCNHCPFARLYSKRLNDLHRKYSALHVPLIAINSMDSLIYREESFENMRTKAINDSLHFPYLQDPLQIVGKMFGALHTPSAYVIWKENNVWKIKYKGCIDDNGENPMLAKPHVADAVDDLLSGKKVHLAETPSFGCRIIYRK